MPSSWAETSVPARCQSNCSIIPTDAWLNDSVNLGAGGNMIWAGGNSARTFCRQSLSGLALSLTLAMAAFGAEDPAKTGSGSPEADRTALESLFAHWQAHQSDIATARLTYRSFHNAVEGKRTLAELDELLDSGRLDRNPERFREFIAAMNGGPFRIDPPWGEGTIIVRDAQRRSDLGPFTSIEDRDICVDYDPLNTQFDVSSAGGSQHHSDDVAMFRPLPPQPWESVRWRIVDRKPARWQLRRILSEPGAEPEVLDGRTWECDPETGLVTKIVRTNDRGQVISMSRYLDPVELPGGVMFSQVFVEAILKERIVSVMHVCAIDTIAVNDPVPDSTFQLPARKNSRIVDYRGPKKLVSHLDQEQSDIAQWLKDHSPVAVRPARRPSLVDHTVRNVLLTGNGLLLIVVGLAIWRRQRMTP